MSNFENPTWRTAAILKIKISILHMSAASRPNCTKFSMQAQILPQATETTKKSEIHKFKMAARRRIENHFLAITQLHILSHYDEIWSEEAESHAYEAGQVIKCLITKILNSGRQHFENGYTSESELRIVQN